MGPSLFTLPELVEELFKLYDTDINEYLEIERLKNITSYFYEDGTRVNAWQNPADFAMEVEDKTTESGVHIIRYLHQARKLYELTANTFIFTPFGYSSFLKKDFIKAGLNFNKLHALKTMHQVNELYFDDPRIIQLFDRYATYNGSDPYQTPGTLSVISHLEHNSGAFFPKQGIYKIVQSLFELSKQNNIGFHFNDPIKEIIVKDKQARGVKANSGKWNFDLLVSDADVFRTYGELLPERKIPQRLLKQQRSSSALIFYWAVDGKHPKLDMHNILFSHDYHEEFRYLFELKNIYEDPTVYVFISSKMVKDDAPEGSENWFVMINAPENTGQDWDALIEAGRKNIIAKINRMLGIDIEPQIRFEEYMDPRRIEERTGSYNGALYGNSSNSRFSAFQRQRNQSGIKNLFFVGGSVHPGGGIPLCLSSAKITAELIKKQNR
jgi:phytoene desaturase